MANLREALVSLLRSNCTNAGNRIGPWRSMQGAALPRVTYHRVSNVRLNLLTGPEGLAWQRYQVDCWGATETAADALAEQARKLNGYSGTVTVGSTGYVIQSIFITEDGDEDEAPAHGDDEVLYRVRIDFLICWKEPAA